MRELAETNYSAVGRKYGVSDNAVRKWVRWYERERAAACGARPYTREWWRLNPIRIRGDAPLEARSLGGFGFAAARLRDAG
jgi:transposase-like protein